jgi:hypothetical protein
MGANNTMNAFDRAKSSRELGGKSEKLFEYISKSKGYSCIEANSYQNIMEHWDYKISAKGKVIRVDVKSAKDNRFDITYLEILGTSGKDGWLLGKADFIAFRQEDHFIYFRRKDLCDWFFKKVGLNNTIEIKEIYSKLFDKQGNLIHDAWDKLNNKYFVKSKWEAVYKLYSRDPWKGKPRHDVMTRAKIEDMKKDLKYWKYES